MIKFDIKYYDNKQRVILSKHNFFPKIETLVENGLEIDKHEFEIYSNFVHQKPEDGWRTKEDLKRRFAGRMQTFRDYFNYDSGTVRSNFKGQDNIPNEYVTRAGVGASLIVMNDLFDLHEADWEKIGISTIPDLDFKASTGHSFIEVESKGTIVDDSTITSSISKQKKSIIKKKQERRKRSTKDNYLFGVITSIPHNLNVNAACRLMDPPSNDTLENPDLFKLLSRLYFYWRNLKLISNTHLMLSLINRIKVLESTKDYKELDNLPLLNRNGEPFDISEKNFPLKTLSIENEVLGEVFPINRELYFYYAFDFEVLNIIKNQSFDSINQYKTNLSPYHENIEIQARVHLNDLIRYGISTEEMEHVKGTKIYITPMRGSIYVSNSGRSVGFFKMLDY